MARSRYSLVSLDELKSAWGVEGFNEVVGDESDVRAVLNALQEATRHIEDYCGVRFVPFLGRYQKELDGNLYGPGSVVAIAPFVEITSITIGGRDITATTVQITENDEINGVDEERIETLSLRDGVGVPSETLVVNGVLGYSNSNYDLPYELAPYLNGAVYTYNAAAEMISVELGFGTDDEDHAVKLQRVVDVLSGRVVGLFQSDVQRLVSFGEAIDTSETADSSTINFAYSLLDPNIIEDPELTAGTLTAPRFYRVPVAVATIVKSRAIKIYNAGRNGYLGGDGEGVDPLEFTPGQIATLSRYRYQTLMG